MTDQDPTPGTAPRPVEAPRRRWRALPYLVFAVLAFGAALTAAVVNTVVKDQEQRLLDQQAEAAGALVSSAFGGGTQTLPLIGVLADPGIGSPLLFDGVAKGFVDSGGAVGVAVKNGDGFVVQSAAGDGPPAGARLDGARAALAARAIAADGSVTDVAVVNGVRRLMFAVVSPMNPNAAVYSEFIFDVDDLMTSDENNPFSELNGALYVGSTADPNRMVVSTTSSPISGDPVVTRTVEVGADEWLMVVSPKGPLVGGFASHLWWIALVAGLVTAALLSTLVGSISRRRAYALRLVDERTHELRAALEERERLEEGQRLAREAAEEANRSKSEFLSRMSHELRTPLNAVLGFAQLLETDDLSKPQHDSVRQILKGGRHLLDLINEVLDITRIETGTFQLSPEPVLANEVIDDVIELTRPLAANSNVQLARGASTDGSDVHVLADRQRLKQILLNLVANAVKYNRPGGSVIVSCERVEPAGLRLKVHDTGPGIRPEHLDMLFTPFERLGAEHTAVEGTGVGLALSRRLAEAMGGTLDVETALGQGSTFWVQLPVVEGPVERFERFNGTNGAAADHDTEDRRTRVLYIEDNLPNLQLVQRILEGHPGIELVTATQGRVGVELARDQQPALVLLDMHLPDVTGDQVLRQLRDDPATSAIPVVVISADATSGQIKRVLAEGAQAYLTKPVDVSELRRLLDELPVLT